MFVFRKTLIAAAIATLSVVAGATTASAQASNGQVFRAIVQSFGNDFGNDFGEYELSRQQCIALRNRLRQLENNIEEVKRRLEVDGLSPNQRASYTRLLINLELRRQNLELSLTETQTILVRQTDRRGLEYISHAISKNRIGSAVTRATTCLRFVA